MIDRGVALLVGFLLFAPLVAAVPIPNQSWQGIAVTGSVDRSEDWLRIPLCAAAEWNVRLTLTVNSGEARDVLRLHAADLDAGPKAADATLEAPATLEVLQSGCISFAVEGASVGTAAMYSVTGGSVG